MKVKSVMLSEGGCVTCDLLFEQAREVAGHTQCANCEKQTNQLPRIRHEKSISQALQQKST